MSLWGHIIKFLGIYRQTNERSTIRIIQGGTKGKIRRKKKNKRGRKLKEENAFHKILYIKS